MRWLWMTSALLLLILCTFSSAAAAGPVLTVLTPADGQVIEGDTVTVVFQASNFNIVPSTIPLSEAGMHPEVNRPGQGHVHLMLDLGPLVVWYKADPYTFNNVAPGQHQLMVELVNNDHSSLSPRVMQMIQFQFAGPGLPVTGKGTAPPLDPFPLVTLGALVIVTSGLIWARSAFHMRW